VSTLSRRIDGAEARLGLKLVERHASGVRLTAAGQQIANAAEPLSSQIDRIAQLASVLAAGATLRPVRVSATEFIVSDVLAPQVPALLGGAAAIAVELRSEPDVVSLAARDADIAVRMVRPVQHSLVARKLGEVAIVAAAHRSYLQRAGTPSEPRELARHRLIGYDRDDTIERGMARMGLPLEHAQFSVRTDDQVAYGRLVASGAGIGFVARYNIRHWPGVTALLPMLEIPPLPCWLAVHREIRSNRLVRRVYDFLAQALPGELAG
jgi:DNA-binding transcriptional LysR family regulator